ncbi:2201_t:CDS:2 [Paraglomus occultum]|uniref:2201_t:CDS:1 n=1 Tax=Paraglomus occultum TaxID=144539 RepID=A0A9N9FI49_9GLOM|nr:2201_t:CDS:2 [Paraglomus occultum]
MIYYGKNYLRKLESLAILDRVYKREIKNIAIQEEVGRAEDIGEKTRKTQASTEGSKAEERVDSDDLSEKRQRITRSMRMRKMKSYTNSITGSESYGLSENNEKNEYIQNNKKQNKKSLKDLLGDDLQCSENMKSHDTLYPSENLTDLRPNSDYFKKLPFEILEPYFKELDDRIENLIPSNAHRFLTEFFQQDLSGEESHIRIDDLRFPNKKYLNKQYYISDIPSHWYWQDIGTLTGFRLIAEHVMDAKIGGLGTKVEGLSSRMDKLEAKMEDLNDKVHEIRGWIAR